jgi:hypothetical protein
MRARPFGSTLAIAAITAVSWGSLVAFGQAPAARSDCPIELPQAFHRCAMEKAKTFVPPRTPDGHPDLRGYWARTVVSFDLEDPTHPKTGDRGGGGAKGTLIVDPPDGKIPYQPWAAAQAQLNLEKYIDPRVSCTMTGPPRASYISPYSLFMQTPGYVVFVHEDMHQTRVIPTDGRPHIGENIRLWGGDLRGRWEGNTLVVDATNLNGLTWIDGGGGFYTPSAHVVERFTLIDADTIDYEATIDDPNVFTKPWKMAAAIKRNKEPRFELLEEACHEGEGDFEHFRKTYELFPGVDGKR